MGRTASLVVAGAVPLVALAFWPMYLSRPFATIDRYTHLHALAGALWLALLIAQPALAYARRFDWHRVLGRASYGLAALFVASSLLLSHYRLGAMDEATFTAEGFNHYLPLHSTLLFALAYGLGLRFRRWPAAHGRFMLCTAIPLVDPVLGRLLAFYAPPFPSLWLYQVVTYTLATAAAAALVFSFRGPAAARQALMGFFAALVGLELGWFVVSPTPAWLEAVRWFRAVPLT